MAESAGSYRIQSQTQDADTYRTIFVEISLHTGLAGINTRSSDGRGADKIDLQELRVFI